MTEAVGELETVIEEVAEAVEESETEGVDEPVGDADVEGVTVAVDDHEDVVVGVMVGV